MRGLESFGEDISMLLRFGRGSRNCVFFLNILRIGEPSRDTKYLVTERRVRGQLAQSESQKATNRSGESPGLDFL